MKPAAQKATGFALMELLIVVSLLAIFLPKFVPNYPDIVGTRISDTSVEETLTIWDASRNYYARNAEWPDESNNCSDALSVLESGNFISNVGPNNRWKNPITTSCSPGNSVIRITQETATDWVSYIQGALPATQITAGATIETTVPAPGTSAQTYSQLSRIEVGGIPELNQMETDLDMNGFDVDNVSELSAEKVTVNDELRHSVTGVRFAELGPWKSYNYSTAYGSGSVPKPSCPAGMTPGYNALPVALCTRYNATRPIERWTFESANYSNRWRIRPVIFANNAYYRPTSSTCSSFKVQTFCQ